MTYSANVELPAKTRMSLGSAMTLGLAEGRTDCKPSTAYLMTYKRGKCTANCHFCPQARESSSKTDMLSRVTWPAFATRVILTGIESAAKQSLVKRVCVQALNYPQVFTDLQSLIQEIRRFEVPTSVSCQPRSADDIRLLADAGAQRIGIALDAATEKLFNRFKGIDAGGPYVWRRQFELLSDAVRIFGSGRVSTHLMAGLGETERQMVRTLQECVDMDVLPALFAFTPIKGTAMQNTVQPPVSGYRRLQVARDLIVHRLSSFSKMQFGSTGRVVGFGVDKKELRKRVKGGEAFITSGCPDCNRPFYNEKPSGPIYNYPRRLTHVEISETLDQLGMDGTDD
jgi:lipoyl synthase